MSAAGSDEALAAALRDAAALIETELDVLLPLPEGEERPLVEAMRYAVLGGGKRMRGFLVIETARLFSVNLTCAVRVA
ncbi:MAG TPA: polyprenyl synthetase family protein, partial [Acidiphilium sp.]|nr:polyprenyl synthetase family protein [Acidiphilium sp.]